jgi:hypothetical protein
MEKLILNCNFGIFLESFFGIHNLAIQGWIFNLSSMLESCKRKVMHVGYLN